MARWSDLAVWRGPTVNEGDGDGRLESSDRMYEYNGVVIHIAAGYYEGTISWQRNASADVSSHFVIGREPGQAAQMVDTDIRAWTQGSGNGRWISIENAGFLKGHNLWRPGWEQLSPYQIEMNAQIFARGHQVYGWPLQLTNHPSRDGLGYHGMGAENGFDWGHLHCPGEPIKAQLPQVLARAIEIVNGGDDMALEGTLVQGTKDNIQKEDPAKVFLAVNNTRWHVPDEQTLNDIRTVSADGRSNLQLRHGGKILAVKNLLAFGPEVATSPLAGPVRLAPEDMAELKSALPTAKQVAAEIVAYFANPKQ